MFRCYLGFGVAGINFGCGWLRVCMPLGCYCFGVVCISGWCSTLVFMLLRGFACCLADVVLVVDFIPCLVSLLSCFVC